MTDEPAGGRHLLTIGQLAGYAGVTIKAVRVYHDRGLLPEPPRDGSGYRRYGPDHAVRLIKIRTLAEAGVPLARVGELLGAGPERLAAAVDEIDRDLLRRCEQLHRTRQRITQLRDGDRLYVSAEVADCLDRLRAMGVSERGIQFERDMWILLRSIAPDQAAAWIADKLAALADPEFRELYRDHDAAYDWAPDDPRLAAIAGRTRAWVAGRAAVPQPPAGPATRLLTAVVAGAASPAWTRIAALAAEEAVPAEETVPVAGTVPVAEETGRQDVPAGADPASPGRPRTPGMTG